MSFCRYTFSFQILSATAKTSYLIMLQLFPACFSCSNSFKLSQNSLKLENESFVSVSFHFDESLSLTDTAIIAEDLGNLIRNLFLSLLLPVDLSPKFNCLAN